MAPMEFPKFKTDAEMAAWFEAHNIEADALAIADDVVVSPDMKITSYVSPPTVSASTDAYSRPRSATAAATIKGNRNLQASR
jgi:hypothetical protein